MLTLHEVHCTHGTDPVKLIPAKWGDAVIVSPKTGPSAGTKLTTPGGTPASRIILNIVQFDRTAVSDGFHRTALPYNEVKKSQISKESFLTKDIN